MSTLSIITTTVETAAQADALAAAIIEARLAACVQITPIQSVYRWKGLVEHTAERLLIAKTSTARADALVAFIRTHHPYELPEILVTSATAGSPDYLAWVTQETRPE